MDINLDRPRRVRNNVAYWCVLLGVAALLTFLMERFTGSILIALGLSCGMLAYMLIMAAIASKNMHNSPGDGRLD
jgi:Na+-translocating ferredoxin:NAD+ oxidoreductase RnfA subunit